MRGSWGRFAIVVLGTALLVGGCKEVTGWLEKVIEPLVEARVENAIRSLRADLEARSKSISELETQIQWIELTERFNRTKYKDDAGSLSSDCQHYSVARTNIGAVIVSCDGIVPYLDGFKVRLKAAPLVPIEVKGLKIKITWQEEEERYQEKGKGRWRTKEIENLHVFQPGRYSSIEVPLTPASAAGLKNFSVGVTADEIRVLPALQQR